MEFRILGNSGVKVSALCLGTMTFGEADEKSFMHGVGCDEATAFRILDAALDAGVNFLDTADVYGQDGLTERVLGRWFAASGKRDRVVLATKFRFRMAEGPNGTGASRLRIMRAVEDSLRRLGTDRVDLYQAHMQDVDTPEEETLHALDDLTRQGKILYAGASNYAAYRLSESLWTSRTRNLTRFVSLQAQYSLLVRDLEREHVPLCQLHNVGILPWSPLAAGFLSGKFRRNQPPPGGARLAHWKERMAQYDKDRSWRILDALDAVAATHRATPAQVALAWLLRRPMVHSVVFGARTVEQLTDNLRALQVKLTDEDMKLLGDASSFELGYPYDFIQRIQGRW
jgi:aryl-alcohol dehydrogenase-like predicted oxidoreductase